MAIATADYAYLAERLAQLEARSHQPAPSLFSSLTVKVGLVLVAVAFAAIFAAAALAQAGIEVPLVSDFIDFLKVIFGSITARNTITDGIMPRIPQAVAANKEGTAALTISTAAPQPAAPVAPTPTVAPYDPWSGLQATPRERPP